MKIATADLWDENVNKLRLLNLDLKSYGSNNAFYGEVVTLKLHEDNSLVRKVLEEEGSGKVLVIDGGGSKRCALIGDRIATLAMNNNWEGIIVYGCIRDSAEIDKMEIGLKALGTCPIKSIKRNIGWTQVELILNGTEVKPGQYIYADQDGVLLSDENLMV